MIKVKKSFIFAGILVIVVLIVIFTFFTLKSLNNTPYLEGKSAPVPTITLNGNNMDHNYDSFCWNKDCSQTKHNPTSIPITNVNKGDIIEISWKNFKNKPNRVILHNITTGETIAYHLADSDIEIDVPEQVKHFQYEVMFQWYLGQSNDLKGESFLNFGVNPYKE